MADKATRERFGRYISRDFAVGKCIRVRRIGSCGLWRGQPTYLVGLRHGRGRGLCGRRVLYWERVFHEGRSYPRPIRLDRLRQTPGWLRADRERRKEWADG